MQLALEYGKQLLSFSCQEEAEKTLLSLKDACLKRIDVLASNQGTFMLDFTPDSLKKMEAWFFELFQGNKFRDIGTSQQEFETCMAMYFGEVAVKNNKAKWEVEKYFLGNDKYTLGIRKNRLFAMTLQKFSNLPLLKNNKRRNSIFRKFTQYFDS